MSQSEPAPFQPPSQPPKPYWTAGKIVALVLVALLIVGVSGFAAFNYLNNRLTSPSGSSGVCTNGATNYPSCNNNSCSNGTTNFPSCSSCPYGQSFVGGSCYGNCTNGATNPPSCNNNVCSNGATNYPTCTIFNTTTSLSCSPTSIMSHQLNSSACIVTVTATVAAPPTGTVDFRASYSWFANSCYQGSTMACQLVPLSGGYSSQFTLSGVSVQDNKGSLTVYAHYNGDNSHLTSDGQFTLSVVNPPTTVTVTGTVSTAGTGTHPVKIEFVNTSTGISYSAVPSSGSYTITLSNLQTYNVLIDWNGAFGSSGTCSAGTLDLQSSADTLYVNYRC